MSPGARFDCRSRNHAAYWAFLVHRVSGLLLIVFVPLHMIVLGQALHGEAALQGLLRWTEDPALKLAETALVAVAAAHLAGGLRVLWLEAMPWRNSRKDLVAIGAGASLAVAALFGLAVFL